MTEATVLGSLLIQLGMDSAQFERATVRAQSSVQKMAQSIGAQAKDVVDASNRMGMSITSFSTQVQTLQARLNPGAQALANYRKEVSLLKEAYRIGAISQDQFGTSLRTAIQGLRGAETGMTATGGASRQLMMQFSQMGQQVMAGTSVMQAFAMQLPDMAVVMGSAGKEASTMAKIIGGPWGIALTTGIALLASLIPSLMQAGDAMKDVQLASNGLADAQSALGQMYDLTTGKLKSQNEMLRLNAELMAYNLRIQAANEKANYQKTMGTFGQGATGTTGVSLGQRALGVLGVDVSGSYAREAPVREIATSLNAGKISSETALRRAEGLNFDGLSVSREEFLGAIRDGVSFPDKQKISDEMLKTLDSGVLSPMFREPAKTRRGPKEKTQDQKDDIYQDQLDKLAKDRADIEARNNQTIEQKYTAQLGKIDEDLAAYDRNVDLNKNLTEPRKEELKQQASINAQMKRDQALNEKNLAVANQGFELDQNSLQQQIEQLELQEQLTTSTADRQKIALEILALQDKLRTSANDQVMANNSPDTVAWQNAFDNNKTQDATAGQRRQVVINQNLSPLQSYAKGLQDSVTNINDAMQNIQVDGINGLVDGLANAAAGTQKLGDVFKNVAQQIIADLVRIQLQKAIVGTLGKVLGGIGGGSTIGGLTGAQYSSSLTSSLSSYGSGLSVSVAGARAGGGPVIGGLPYLVGERGPEIVVPGHSGSVISNDNLANMGGGGTTHNYYGPGADQFWGQVRGEAANVAAPMSVASGVQARSAAGSDVARAARRRMPGR